MAVITKKTFPATTNNTTTVFSPVGIQLNNPADLDVYITLSGGTRVLQLNHSSSTSALATHPQVNNTDGLYYPAVSVGTTLNNYQLSTDNNTITFNSALPSGAVVFCERRTRDADGTYTSFASGSTIRATDLNNSARESNFTAQEARNKAFDLEGKIYNTLGTAGHVVKTTDTGSITSNMIANGTIKAEDIETGALDGRYYTETEAEALFLRQDSSETIASGTAWSGTDSKVATTAAIDARIIDLIEEVGGFVPVANETSFPTSNPDINNGNGTIVSVKAVSTTLTPSSGTLTIPNGAGTGNTVTITGVTGTVLQGFGMLLETTTTLHTYVFHRVTAKATEVHTVASNITNINAVADNKTNIDAAVANSTNINEVAGNFRNINTVAGQITLAEDLGSITNSVTTWTGNDINTVATNIDEIKDVADALDDGTIFDVDDTNKTTGSVIYYDGSKFKADTTTTKNTLVTGGNF